VRISIDHFLEFRNPITNFVFLPWAIERSSKRFALGRAPQRHFVWQKELRMPKVAFLSGFLFLKTEVAKRDVGKLLFRTQKYDIFRIENGFRCRT